MMPAEVAELLDRQRDVTLFMRDANGCPIGYPMTIFARPSHNAEIVFSTYRKSAKMRHLERDGRVVVLAMRAVGDAVQWVSLAGHATVWSPTASELDGLPRTMSATHEARVPEGLTGRVRDRLLSGKRVLIRIVLTEPERAALAESRR